MIITLLTDFGTTDHYVAATKGVILSLLPRATLVDISHDVPPQDIHAAGYLLAACYGEFPSGTVHLVVVDPGVGSKRLPIVTRISNHFFVGPDNGVFSFAWGSSAAPEVRRIERRVPGTRSGGATFHGRDLFAPVAAALANNVPLESLGALVRDPVRLRIPQLRSEEDGRLAGEVIHIDRFGNCVTNLPVSAFPAGAGGAPRFRVGSIEIDRLEPFYASAKAGAPFAIRGSGGYIEIAVRDGSAARTLGISRGTPVVARVS